MLICIDSCVFIRAFDAPDSSASFLLQRIGSELQVAIPRLVVHGVERNLRSYDHIKTFYRLFVSPADIQVVDLPVPQGLIAHYVSLGLRVKGDAIIGAFAEWMGVDYLISDNRHFLRELRTVAYHLASPGEFLELLERKARP